MNHLFYDTPAPLSVARDEYKDENPFVTDREYLSEEDMALIETLRFVAPTTTLGAGDICTLISPTRKMLLSRKPVPRMWQVRFVISRWTYGAFKSAVTLRSEGPTAWEDCLRMYGNDVYTMLRNLNPVPSKDYRQPMVYAHGFPHGHYPDTAHWFIGSQLQGYALRAGTEIWPSILDEAKAPYLGVEVPTPVCLDFAPDLYGKGEAIGRPFSFEDTMVDTLALLGHEEFMMRPVDPRTYRATLRE